jgi:hypothetical protein
MHDPEILRKIKIREEKNPEKTTNIQATKKI